MTPRSRATVGAALAAALTVSLAAAPSAAADPIADAHASVQDALGFPLPPLPPLPEMPSLDPASLEALLPPAGGEAPVAPGQNNGPSIEMQRNQIEAELRARINDYRAQNGLSRASWDSRIDFSSRWWAEQRAHRGAVGHIPPSNLPYPAMGENIHVTAAPIAWQSAASSAINGWRNSPGHHRNLLNTRTKSHGVGVALNQFTGQWTVVYQFRT